MPAARVRVIVTGDRNWRCDDLAERVVSRLLRRHGPGLVIVHGAAAGVDSAFAAACEDLAVAHEPHPARWDELGLRAGPARNSEMVALGAALAVAVHRRIEWSKGTRDCANKCIVANIPVYLIDGDDAEPRRIHTA